MSNSAAPFRYLPALLKPLWLFFLRNIFCSGLRQHINNDRNGDIVLNALIAEFIALGIEHHMTGNVLETQDFYEFPPCSNTIVSTCAVLGNRSTPWAFTAR